MARGVVTYTGKADEAHKRILEIKEKIKQNRATVTKLHEETRKLLEELKTSKQELKVALEEQKKDKIKQADLIQIIKESGKSLDEIMALLGVNK